MERPLLSPISAGTFTLLTRIDNLDDFGSDEFALGSSAGHGLLSFSSFITGAEIYDAAPQGHFINYGHPVTWTGDVVKFTVHFDTVAGTYSLLEQDLTDPASAMATGPLGINGVPFTCEAVGDVLFALRNTGTMDFNDVTFSVRSLPAFAL